MLLAVVLLASCGASLDDVEPAEGVTTVEAADNVFRPQVIHVDAGTEVTWEFVGNRDHNVVGDGWASDVMREGTFARSFEEPGTYDYSCTLHGGMNGRLVVTAPESMP